MWIWVKPSESEWIGTCLNKIKWIWMRLWEHFWIWTNLCEPAWGWALPNLCETVSIWVSQTKSEWDWVELGETIEWIWTNLNETEWIWERLSESEWIQAHLNESEHSWARWNESKWGCEKFTGYRLCRRPSWKLESWMFMIIAVCHACVWSYTSDISGQDLVCEVYITELLVPMHCS